MYNITFKIKRKKSFIIYKINPIIYKHINEF